MDTETTAPKGEIHKAIAAIMGDVGGVAKGRQNTQQNYKFRGIADIYKACQPLMAKNGVHLAAHAILDEQIAERETKSGGAMIHIRQRIEFRFYHSDGSWFPCVTTGEAMDTGDKASNKCMSAAVKYALITTFAIPEEDPDVDTENSSPEVKANAAPPVRSAGRAAKAAAPAQIDKALRINQLACFAAPQGLGWAKPRAISWLKKRFGVDTTAKLDEKQLADAELLLVYRLESEDKYRTTLELMATEGRVLGDGEVAA
jgi:hypothetical protein